LLQEFYAEHKDVGFTAIAALHASSSDPITTSDVASWVEEFSSTHPVLGDFDKAVYDQYRVDPFRPQYVLFDREMNILMTESSPDAHEVALATTLAAL